MRKNTFGFAVLAATASLGLGLVVSGCGDSGSTTPNPLGPQKANGQVIFDYNVLSKNSTAKAIYLCYRPEAHFSGNKAC